MKISTLTCALTATAAHPGFPAGLAIIERLFDHLPDTVFFLKDRTGRYVAVNQTLVERCGFPAKSDLIGRHVREIFPAELAERYAAQDASVLRTGRPILDRLELHWYPSRRTGWCLTTKLPWRDADGHLTGLAGVSRDLRAPGDAEIIPPSLVGVLDFLETHYAEEIPLSSLAQRAGLSPVRFARLIKRIFRVPPGLLVTQIRLAAAARLLQETGDSITSIAFACGFCDHSAFTRTFKSAAGVPPTEFRKRS